MAPDIVAAGAPKSDEPSRASDSPYKQEWRGAGTMNLQLAGWKIALVQNQGLHTALSVIPQMAFWPRNQRGAD